MSAMRHESHCPTDALLALVSQVNHPSDETGEFSREQSALFEHLERCDSCRKLLESSAASESSWQDIHMALNAVPIEASSTGATKFLPGLAWPDSSQATAGETLPTGQRTAGTKEPAWQLLLQALAPSDDPAAAGRVGNFEILGVIGTGGMGIVLKAREPALDRIVAIKILSPHLASSKSARKRFAREARAAAAVIHDNVIPIYGVAEWNDLPYLVMPYLPDPSLAERIERDGPLSIEATLSVGMQVARGLAAAHTQGLVHRDVKPANVLLSKGTERAVITDFGLARTADDASLTRAGVLAGTPHYMSPEQAKGEKVDARSDLFSLGCILYAMLTGHSPVNEELGSQAIERLAQHDFHGLPEGSRHPAWFRRLVNWLLAKKPADRPESAALVADLMERALAHLRQPSKSAVPSELSPPRKQSRTIFGRVLTAGLAVAVLMIATLPLIVSYDNPLMLWHSPSQENNVPPATDSPPANPAGPTKRAPELKYADPVLLNWDYTEAQLDAIDMELDELEGSVHR
ncbi:MAG: serine/threonine-protein kinase [Aureliella sp.]